MKILSSNMLWGITKSLFFFLLIKIVFVLVGGTIYYIFDNSKVDEPSILNSLSYVVGGGFIAVLIKKYFPLISDKTKKLLQPSTNNILNFLIGFAIIILLFSAIILIGEKYGYVQNNFTYEDSLSVRIIISLFFLSLFIGFFEEYIYRGVITEYIFQKIGIRSGLFLSPFLFSIGHIHYDGILPFISAFIMGLLSILLLLKTNSLLFSIGIHTGWNLAYFIYQRGKDLEMKVLPIWGNLFELFQISILILFVFGVIYHSNANNKSFIKLKQT